MARKPMTEEEKKAFAEKMKAARAKKAAEAEKAPETAGNAAEIAQDETTTAEAIVREKPAEREKAGESDEVAQLKEMVRQLQAQIAAQQPQIIQVSGEAEKVVMRFQAEVADDNVAVFGPNAMYGQVTGKVGMVTVPKSEWSRFYTDTIRNMINRRWLVVLSGMTDEEREIYNCAYKEGEVLDQAAFNKLLDMGRDLLDIFPDLCTEHQEMVVRRFWDAYNDGDARAKDRDLIVALNDMSKTRYKDVDSKDPRRKGAFYPIIAAMNEEDAR